MEEIKKNFKREIKSMIYTEISNNRKHLFKKIETQLKEIFKQYKKKIKKLNQDKNISIKEETNFTSESNILSSNNKKKTNMIKKEKLLSFINKKIDDYLLPREEFLNNEIGNQKINSKKKNKTEGKK
jgi:hypothetical protein